MSEPGGVGPRSRAQRRLRRIRHWRHRTPTNEMAMTLIGVGALLILVAATGFYLLSR